LLRRTRQTALLLLLLAPAAFAAQRDVGVLFQPPTGAYTPQLSSLADALLNAVCALDGWRAVLLYPESPFLDTTAAQQQVARIARGDDEAGLSALARELDLDDVFIINIAVAEAANAREKARLAIRWARADHDDARGFDVLMQGLTPGDMQAAAQRLAAQLVQGFAAAQVISPSADNTSAPTAADAQRPPAITPPPVVEPVATPPAITTQTPVPEPEKPPAAADTPPEAVDTVEVGGKQADDHVKAGRAALAVGDLEMARRETDLAFKHREPLVLVYLLRADLAGAEKDLEGRRKWLERAARADNRSLEPLLRLGALYRAQGLWQKAIDNYDAAIAIDAGCMAAYVGAAAVLTNQGRPRQATTYLSEAVARNPQDNSLLVKLADAYRQADMLPEAEETYDLAARTAEPSLRGQIFDKLGDLYVSVSRFQEAFYCYAEATRLTGDRDHPVAQKRYQQIMATADQAVKTSLQTASDTYTAYAVDRTLPREKAYVASEQAGEEIGEAVKFAKAVVPPEVAAQLHLRRQLFYNLALEAVVNLMTYLDTNMELPLNRYQTAAREAETEFEQLRKLREL